MKPEQLILHGLLNGYERLLKRCDAKAADLHEMYEACVEAHGKDSPQAKKWSDKLHDFVGFAFGITDASHRARTLVKESENLDPLTIKDPEAFWGALMMLTYPEDREKWRTDPFLVEVKALYAAAKGKKP